MSRGWREELNNGNVLPLKEEKEAQGDGETHPFWRSKTSDGESALWPVIRKTLRRKCFDAEPASVGEVRTNQLAKRSEVSRSWWWSGDAGESKTKANR